MEGVEHDLFGNNNPVIFFEGLGKSSNHLSEDIDVQSENSIIQGKHNTKQ